MFAICKCKLFSLLSLGRLPCALLHGCEHARTTAGWLLSPALAAARCTEWLVAGVYVRLHCCYGLVCCTMVSTVCVSATVLCQTPKTTMCGWLRTGWFSVLVASYPADTPLSFSCA
jgi:hypothetical protein